MKTIILCVAALVGCYTPRVDPCVVTCSDELPCPGEMVCGRDFHCHAEGEEPRGCTFEVTLEIRDDEQLLPEPPEDPGKIEGGSLLSCTETCTTAIEGGELIELVGVDTSAFITFAGDCIGRACSFVVERDMHVVANVANGKRIIVDLTGDGVGGVTSTPDGIDCPGVCTATFAKDEPVTLTPSPLDPSVFVEWGGNVMCPDATCSVVDGANMTAEFNVDRLVVAPVGVGGAQDKITIEASGHPEETCVAPCERLYAPSSVHIKLSPDTAGGTRTLREWVGVPACEAQGPDTVCEFDLVGDLVAVGIFEPLVVVTVFVDENGVVETSGGLQGTINPPTCGPGPKNGTIGCPVAFRRGDTVTIKDIAGHFVDWSGCPSDPTPPIDCIFDIDGDISINATFREPVLTLNVGNGGKANISPNPNQNSLCESSCQFSFPYNTPIVLTAVMSPGFVWTCPGVVNGATCTFSLTADRTASLLLQTPPG